MRPVVCRCVRGGGCCIFGFAALLGWLDIRIKANGLCGWRLFLIGPDIVISDPSTVRGIDWPSLSSALHATSSLSRRFNGCGDACCGSRHALHPADPAICQAHFDASGMVASGQELRNGALDCAARWLISFEYNIYKCPRHNLCCRRQSGHGGDLWKDDESEAGQISRQKKSRNAENIHAGLLGVPSGARFGPCAPNSTAALGEPCDTTFTTRLPPSRWGATSSIIHRQCTTEQLKEKKRKEKKRNT
jgi:hypothetical protein